MNTAITEELNNHSLLVNSNVKQNLVIQKQEFDGMIKRLGLNLQEALNKIKNETTFEYTDLFSKLEEKLNSNIKAIS